MHTMITAHSGCDGTADNSFEYLHHALGCGADAFEVDVRIDPGGRFYLSHDPSEDACPELPAAFELLKGSNKLINCDLKMDGLELDILALARRMGVAGQLLFSGSVSLSVLRESEGVRRRTLFNLTPILPHVIAHYRDGARPTGEEWAEAIRVCQEYQIAAVNIPFELCTERAMELLTHAGIWISAWTVNEEGPARRLLDYGVFNITTRDTKLLCALRDELR